MQYRLSEFFRGGSLLLPTSVIASIMPRYSEFRIKGPRLIEIVVKSPRPLLKVKNLPIAYSYRLLTKKDWLSVAFQR